MKTQSKQKIELAQELLSVIEQRKALEKRESELKTYFKDELGNKPDLLEAGNVVIMLIEKARTSLDKEGLTNKFGIAVISEFEKTTTYLETQVKKVS